jgi:hypothetical protein
MPDPIGVLQNDPNHGLRTRLEGPLSAQETLDLALLELQEAVRVRLESASEPRRRGHRRR